MSKYNRDTDAYITNRALELVASDENVSESQIARIISEELGLDISRNTVHGRIYRRKNTSGLEDKPRPIMPYFSKYQEYFLKKCPPEMKVTYDFSKGPLKILVVNDTHFPFQHEEALEKALIENRSADIVITSDVSDMYSLTPYAKDKHVSFEAEVEEIIRWFEYLNENFPASYILHACHDKRLSRYITTRIRSDLLFLIETDLLSLLARPFSRVHVIPEVYYAINDAMFSHLRKHSATIPMRCAHKAHQWFQNWKTHLGIKDYKVLVQAHGHHSGIVNFPEVQLVETGCLQRIPDWVLRQLPSLPWVYGWTVLYQNDGVTDRNATQVAVFYK